MLENGSKSHTWKIGTKRTKGGSVLITRQHFKTLFVVKTEIKQKHTHIGLRHFRILASQNIEMLLIRIK